jgi:hypothetical protein
MPTRTPSNGLETANQKQKSQSDSLAVGFVFTLFSQAFEHRHFTQREISFGNPTILMFALVAVSEDLRCRRDDATPRSASAASSMTIRNAFFIRHRSKPRLSESSFTGSPAELCLRWVTQTKSRESPKSSKANGATFMLTAWDQVRLLPDHIPNLLLRTAKKNAVESPHIKIPVKPSSGPKSRHSLGSTRSP